jgi:hypothetical protein
MQLTGSNLGAGKSPEAIARAFLSLAVKGQWDDAAGYLLHRNLDVLQFGVQEGIVTPAGVKLLRIEILSASPDPNTGGVFFFVDYALRYSPSDKDAKGNITLLKQNGIWVITGAGWWPASQ